ncbi:MAG: DNA internalization-related competence protein ComEC/Rec2 [Bacillota bacterium]
MFFFRNLLKGRLLKKIAICSIVSIMFSAVFCDYLGCIALIIFASSTIFLLLINMILKKNNRFTTVIFFLTVVSISSISYASIRHYTEKFFENRYLKTNVYLAKVNSYPKFKGDLSEYEIEIDGGKVKLSTWKVKKGLEPGDIVEIIGKITAPEGSRNPGGFDNKAYLINKGISGEIFVGEKDIKVTGHYNVNPLFVFGQSIKNLLINSIRSVLPEKNAALLNSMLIGYTDDLDQETKQDFSDSGLSHLMAVSGMNVTFVLIPILFLSKLFGVKRKRSGIVGLFSLIVFIFITGFAASIVRASIMAAVILVAKMIDRESDFGTSIALASIIMIVVNPMIVFDLGFQFSFSATIGIVIMGGKLSNWMQHKRLAKPLAEVLSVTLAAQLAVLPIMVNYFNQISLISVISNLLVVPLSGLITVLGFILAGFSQIIILSNPLAIFENLLLELVRAVANYSALVPGAVMKIPDFGVVGTLIYFLLLGGIFNFRLLSKRVKNQKLIIIVLIIALIILGVNFTSSKELSINVFDVGQGDCILVTTPNGRHVMIDTGDGKTDVSKILFGMGISSLDAVVLTHPHNDHIGGYEKLTKDIRVFKTFSESVRNGSYAQIDEVRLDFLNPSKNTESNDENDANDNSIVTLLTFKKFGFLLTGDIGADVEEKLLASNLPRNTEILKVAHHGSSYSSSENFLAYNAFQNGIISVGKNNYGHPSQKIIDRLNNSGMSVYRTDYGGAVNIRSDGSIYSISSNMDVAPCGRLIDEFVSPKKTYRAR